MSHINNIFNETELDIFFRQTGFNFGNIFLSEDGTICAVDIESGLLFIGKDLLTRNVHDIGSVSSVDMEDGAVCLKFKDSATVQFTPDDGDAGMLFSTLQDCVTVVTHGEDTIESGMEEAPEDTDEDEGDTQEIPYSATDDRILVEVYSRLINTGRREAISFLISDAGMKAEDAEKYIESIEDKDDTSIPEAELPSRQENAVHGWMSDDRILDTLKGLRPGDKIHIEYKALLGKIKTFEGEFSKMDINIIMSRYFSLQRSAGSYESLVDEIALGLSDKIKIHFFCKENLSKHSCSLTSIKTLKKL